MAAHDQREAADSRPDGVDRAQRMAESVAENVTQGAARARDKAHTLAEAVKLCDV